MGASGTDAPEAYKRGGKVKKCGMAKGGIADMMCMDADMPKSAMPEMMSDNDEDDMPVRRRMDRPGRKRGGRAGADVAPLSSAAKSEPCY